MFNQEPFANDVIRKYIIFFGTLFNDIKLLRDDESGDEYKTLKVPLNYGPKEKFLARLEGNPDLEREIALQLPRMSFELNNFQYDNSRKLSSTGRIRSVGQNPNSFQFQYNPVPYNIDISLSIMVKNAEDGTRIIEQILPYFTPEYTGTLNLVEGVGQSIDIPLSLNSVRQNDTYEGDFIQRRALIWTLDFTLKGWLFGPNRSAGSIIKQVEINFKSPNASIEFCDPNDPNIVEVIITPGLTSNGEATSNADLSIDKNLIMSTDDFGFIKDLRENL